METRSRRIAPQRTMTADFKNCLPDPRGATRHTTSGQVKTCPSQGLLWLTGFLQVFVTGTMDRCGDC